MGAAPNVDARQTSRAHARSCLPSSAACGIVVSRHEQRSPKRLSHVTQCSTSQATGVESDVEMRKALKDKLSKLLLETDGNLTDESKAVIRELESLAPYPEPVKPALWNGNFQLLNSSMQNVLYRGAIVTLGRATFNAFKPVDLKIRMEEVYNDVGIEFEDAYHVIIPFTVAQEDIPPLQGLLVNRARCHPSSQSRMEVEFLSSTLRPANENVDLTQWLQVFQKENSGMGDDGVLQKELPPAKGWLDITYSDEDFRITNGNFGTTVVVQRLKEPVVAYS